jgi:ABC-type transport system involved in cytochrome c biogenesis permease subunit
MDRLTVLCFAGTYGLALLSELVRFAMRARPHWLLTVGLTALGWAVHTAYLANLARLRGGVPITSFFESMIVLGWVLAAIALYLIARGARERPTAAGLVLLSLVLVLLSVAGLWAPRRGTSADWSNALTFWGTIHGLFLMLGAVCTCLAFVFGLLYLAQSRHLKSKQPAARFLGLSLPSLEQSERWHRAAIMLAFPLLTAGILTAIGLMVALRRDGQAPLSWTDPKIVSTAATWIVFAALLHARFRPDWRGRRVMVLTFVAFAFMAFAMVGVGLILPTAHSGLSILPVSAANAAGEAP